MVDPKLQHTIRRQKQIRLIMARNCKLRRSSSTTEKGEQREEERKQIEEERERRQMAVVGLVFVF